MSKITRGHIDAELLKARSRQGDASIAQMFGGGSPVAGDAAVYDDNGNVVPGGGLSGGSFGVGSFFVEQPKGLLNGSNTVFTLTYVPAFVICLWLNGAGQNPFTPDYTISGNTITYTDAPSSNAQHWIVYIRAGTAGTAGKQAREFAAGTDGVDYGNSLTFNVLGDLSVGVWLKLPSTAAGTIITRGYNSATVSKNSCFDLNVKGSSGAWEIQYYHDPADGGVSEDDKHNFSTALANDTWYYIGFSRDATAKTVSMFVGDGVTVALIQTWTYPTDPTGGSDSAVHLSIGQLAGGYSGNVSDAPLVGTVEEHYIWSRKLSLAEHQDAMRGSPSPTNLILDCLMGNSPEVDLSPTGASGTVTGTTLVTGH